MNQNNIKQKKQVQVSNRKEEFSKWKGKKLQFQEFKLYDTKEIVTTNKTCRRMLDDKFCCTENRNPIMILMHSDKFNGRAEISQYLYLVPQQLQNY